MKILTIIMLILLSGKIFFAQNSNLCSISRDTIVTDSANQQRMLLGFCNRQVFQDTSFSWWFNSLYDMYEVDSITASKIKGTLNNITIAIVMGTWCSDSRKLVPKFFKILDYLKFSDGKISILTVGRNKKGKANETDSLKIELVPTIIFYRNGAEIGRIVESPKETLERDLLKILSG